MRKHLLLFVMLLLPVAASAYDIAVENSDGVTIRYNYINNGTELEVVYGYYKGDIVIPEEVTYMNRTRKVTSIGESAFSGCSLTSVTIPNSVTSIAYAAFYDCSGLTSITIPNSVTSIGEGAFADCFGLTSVTISNSVTNIARWAFNCCSGLTSVTIPNSVTSIGYAAFYLCSSLTSVTIGNSVTSIDEDAFGKCSSLQKVIVPDIAAWCGITFSGSGSNPLYYVHHLYRDENTEIKDLVIPNSVKIIRDRAFSGCTGLTSVTIPNSVTSIRESAFRGCSGLTSVTIGNSVKSIWGSAFENCSGLTSVTIPNSVTYIGASVFEGANISTVISLIDNPFEICGKADNWTRTFSLNTYNNATLYVPVGTINKYKATKGWKDFLFIEEGNPTGINVVENTKDNNTTIYDLNGVRLIEPKKGINIINGRKYVRK